MYQRAQRGRSPHRSKGAVVLAVGLAMTAAGCDNILDVEIPGRITEAGTFIPSQAEVLVNSAIADVECAMSDFIASNAAGNESVSTKSVGWWGTTYQFGHQATTTNCSTVETAFGWFVPLHKGRWMAERVYERLNGEWTDQQVANRQRLMATSAIYAGITYTVFGEYFCEMAADTGPLMSWEQSLETADVWFTRALTHIQAGGDFAVPTGVTTSARQMALLLRARARFAKNDLPGAAADAQMITRGFNSWITREAGGERTRWNRVFAAHLGQPGWVPVLGPIDFWTGPPNPATGQPWPRVIPFTGYWNLGILPDGRAVTADQYPITTTASPGAVADTRVRVTTQGTTAGPRQYPVYRPEKYMTAGAPMPMAKWEEAWLILAQIRGGQEAIDRVNEIRTAHSLPRVTYLAANDAAGIQDMLIEEIRRVHFLEGRFWSTKLRYNLWFPRGSGQDAFAQAYGTAVRMLMPANEYLINPNFTQADEGRHCPQFQRPI